MGANIETRIPGIKAGHQRITPTCRANRGLIEAFDEATTRLRATYADYAADDGSEGVTWHVVLIREDS